MTEKRRKAIVFLIFIIAIVWGAYNFPFGGKQDSWNDPAGHPSADTLNSAVIGKLAQTDLISAGTEWGRDPFARKTKYNPAKKNTSRKLRLTAISGSDGGFMAIINGKILAVGETIEGWTIMDISDKTAVLAKDMNKISLSIEGGPK